MIPECAVSPVCPDSARVILMPTCLIAQAFENIFFKISIAGNDILVKTLWRFAGLFGNKGLTSSWQDVSVSSDALAADGASHLDQHYQSRSI